ncbi:hypothetical protein BJX62DRAFT_26197 [Aspergillus germanicus]
MADTSGPRLPTPYPEIEDPIRAELIDRISKLQPGLAVDSAFWAFCWISDVEMLKEWVKYAEVNKSILPHVAGRAYVSDEWREALRVWTSSSRAKKSGSDETARKKREASLDDSRPTKSPRSISVPSRGRSTRSRSISRSGAPTPQTAAIVERTSEPDPAETPAASTPTSLKAKIRQVKISRDCKRRDEYRCVVTGGGDAIEAAHIYPYALGARTGDEAVDQFWEKLRCFWPAEVVDAWHASTDGPESTEQIRNELTLAATPHRMWDQGRIGLNPISVSADGTRMEVEFHFLPELDNKRKDLTTPPPDPRALAFSSSDTLLPNFARQSLLRSGDVLIFTTPSPDELPLPSFELLRMKWVLNRLVALSGAAIDDEDDDDEPGLRRPTTSVPPIAAADEEPMEEDSEEDVDNEYSGDEERFLTTEGETHGGSARTSLLSTTGGPAPVGENRRLAERQSKGVRSEAGLGENPLVLRTRDPNVH